MATNNTSGTYDFNLEIGDVIQEATEMIGGEVTLGEEPRSARRSINLILNDWQNRGVCLWTTNTTIVSIAASTSQVSLGSHVSDVMQVVINRDISTFYKKFYSFFFTFYVKVYIKNFRRIYFVVQYYRFVAFNKN